MTCRHDGGTDPCEGDKWGECKIAQSRRQADYYIKNRERITAAWKKKYHESSEHRAQKRNRRKIHINRAKSILKAHKERGNALQVSPEWVAEFLHRGCPVFDTPYRPACTGHGNDSPTVDHFDPNGGNGENNLWVISRLANVMKNNGTLDHAIKLVGWWATVHHFQRTLTAEEFFKLRDTMNGRIKETIKTTVEEARRCLSLNSNNVNAAKPRKKSSSAAASLKPPKAPRRAAKTPSSGVAAAASSSRSSAAPRQSVLGVTAKEE